MSYYEDYCEENYIEEANELDIDATQEIKSEVLINKDAIAAAVNNLVQSKIKTSLKTYIDREVNKCFMNHYESKIKFEDIMHRIIKEKFEEKYPDTVENKVNEFEAEILKLKVSDRRSDYSMEVMAKDALERIKLMENKANAKVAEYIENELSKSVAKSNEYIEQFSKNYFAQNLFKAMGMMDKMIPTTENIIDK